MKFIKSIFTIGKTDAFIIASDLLLGSFFSIILTDLFSGARGISAGISYSFILVCIVLYILFLLTNRSGYTIQDSKPEEFGGSFPFIVSLNAILIGAILVATLPFSDSFISNYWAYIISLMAFITAWIWIHLAISKKLSSYFTKKTDFSNRKPSFFFVFPFLSMTGVFNSLLYKDLVDSSSEHYVGSIVFFAFFMALIGWLFSYPARRMLFAIKGEKYKKNRLFPFLLISYIVKIVFDLYIIT